MTKNEAREAVREAYDYGDPEYAEEVIKALEQTRWIPISEQLPGEKGSYLLCLDNDYISTAYYDGNQWYVGSEKERIVAWMPLPKPYRAESEE